MKAALAVFVACALIASGCGYLVVTSSDPEGRGLMVALGIQMALLSIMGPWFLVSARKGSSSNE